VTCISTPSAHRGAKGEHLFEGHFLERGIFIAAPKHDLHRVDYVVEWTGNLHRVNVKTLHWVPTGNYYQADTKTSNGKGNRAYTADEIDYLGVVSLEYGHIWLIPLSATKGSTCLRWHPPEKNHRKRFDSFNWTPYLIKQGCTSNPDTKTRKFS
jgi:hypothetical protein